MHRALRRQDRPAHRREAFGEEGSRALEDEVLRLEPGDIALAAFALHAAEADEGVHLVDVAAHAFLHAQEPVR